MVVFTFYVMLGCPVSSYSDRVYDVEYVYSVYCAIIEFSVFTDNVLQICGSTV